MLARGETEIQPAVKSGNGEMAQPFHLNPQSSSPHISRAGAADFG